MMRFSVTEYDSAWQNLYAIQYVKDPKLRAKIFQHILEEVHHGTLFKKAASLYAEGLLPIPMSERKALFNSTKSNDKAIADFFAYEVVGESDVKAEFGSYALAAPYNDIRDIFLRLEGDEKGHALYTRAVLENLMPKATQRFWGLVEVRIQRAYEAWLRFGSLLGELPSTVILTIVYFVGGFPLYSKASKRIQLNLQNEQSPS